MEQRAASVFDTCLEQALQEAEALMKAMGNAALASLRAKLLDSANSHREPVLQDALEQLKRRRDTLPVGYAKRLRELAFLIAQGKTADYHQLMGGDGMAFAGVLESEMLRAQIEWGRAQISLLQQTEESRTALERVYQPLRKITRYWRNGNPLHHTVYLDSLQASLQDQGISIEVTSLFLADMVGVMADHLQISYRRIMTLAMNSYAELLAKAEAKRQADKANTKAFARKSKKLFEIPEHCPVGAVRAYKRLIPVLERLSEHDASFWTDTAHPARLLVQAIVDKATTLKEGGSTVSYPQFPGVVSETVETLSALKLPASADFAQALVRLNAAAPVAPRKTPVSTRVGPAGEPSSMPMESQWDASELISIHPESELAASDGVGLESALAPLAEPSARVTGAAGGAQPAHAGSLDAMEQDVMAMVAMHVRSIDVDPAVLAVLTNAWPRVLYQTAQRAGMDSSSFRAYRQVVPEVLALADAHAGAGVRIETDMLIPSLLTRLKSGLTGIGWMPERIAPVLTALAHMAPSAIVELQVVQEDEVAEVAEAASGSPLAHAAVAEVPAAAPVSVAQAVSAAPAASGAAGLHICGRKVQKGVRLEFLSRGEWIAKELSWSNPQATMFLFTASNGANQSITRRMLEKLEQERAVRAT